MNRNGARRRNLAFTLIELLTVITIVAILGVLSLGAIQWANASARSSACQSNLRQIGTALQLFASENNGCLPAVTLKAADAGTSGDLPWTKQLGPYLPQRSSSATAPENAVFACPAADYRDVAKSDLTRTYCATSAMIHYDTSGSASTSQPRRLTAISDPVNTIVVAEGRQAAAGVWYCSSLVWWSQANGDLGSGLPDKGYLDFRHVDRMNVLYVDGHVGTLTLDSAQDVLRENWEGRRLR